MKKMKILVVLLLVIMTCFVFTACMDDEVSLIFQYSNKSETTDKIPYYYVSISTIVTNSKTAVEFLASDFSIIRNGVKENGTLFITGGKFEQVNDDKTYTSFTASSYSIENDNGATLQIIFSGIDNITEIYYKNQKIDFV